MGVDERPRSEPEVVHAGDQLVTLEERLAAIERTIHRLTWAFVGWVALQLLWAILGPEEFARIVRQLIETAT
jgi:hypothetical protein